MARKKTYTIPEELLEKYHVAPIDTYDTPEEFYFSFLCATDYICNKIVEDVSTWDDYADEKIARAFAREQLSTPEEPAKDGE